MPFGAFNKTCLGEHLTLTLAKKFVTELGLGYTLHVTEDAPQEFSGFHWQPSSRFRVQLAPNSPTASTLHIQNQMPALSA
jgi:hypothetical protein